VRYDGNNAAEQPVDLFGTDEGVAGPSHPGFWAAAVRIVDHDILSGSKRWILPTPLGSPRIRWVISPVPWVSARQLVEGNVRAPARKHRKTSRVSAYQSGERVRFPANVVLMPDDGSRANQLRGELASMLELWARADMQNAPEEHSSGALQLIWLRGQDLNL
jgi:hypothetical protein